MHEVRRARHYHHHCDINVGADEDVSGATAARTRGLGESRSAPAAGCFGRGGGVSGGGSETDGKVDAEGREMEEGPDLQFVLKHMRWHQDHGLLSRCTLDG